MKGRPLHNIVILLGIFSRSYSYWQPNVSVTAADTISGHGKSCRRGYFIKNKIVHLSVRTLERTGIEKKNFVLQRAGQFPSEIKELNKNNYCRHGEIETPCMFRPILNSWTLWKEGGFYHIYIRKPSSYLPKRLLSFVAEFYVKYFFVDIF